MANHAKHSPFDYEESAEDYRASNYVRNKEGRVERIGAHQRTYGYRESSTQISIDRELSEPFSGHGPGVSATSLSSNDEILLAARRKRKRRRVLKVVLGVILAFFLAAGVAIALYINSINEVMRLDDDEEDIRATITKADFSMPVYMLLVGSDWRENSGITNIPSMSGDQQRADVIILARIDKPSKLVTILTIPRDTPFKMADGTYCKLNEVYNEGRGAMLITAVEDLTGIKISHYAEVYFSDFEELIDSLGGIYMDIPNSLDGTDALTGEPIHIDAGRQLLDGKQAMLYARERKTLEGNQDEKRQSNIRVVVNAMAKRITQVSLVELPRVLYGVASCVRTDLTYEDIFGLASDFRNGMTMYMGAGPAAGDIDEFADGKWLCYENPSGWERVMHAVDAGEDPGDISYVGDVCTIAGSDVEVITEEEF